MREIGGRPAWIRVAQYETRRNRVVRLTSEAVRTGGPVTLADFAGEWTVEAVPESGTPTVTTFVLRASEAREGWSILYEPNRDPIPLRVVALAGDSLVLESAPYLSGRRPGVRAVSRDVYRLVDGRLVGYSIGRYLAWPPHTLRLRLEGVRQQ